MLKRTLLKTLDMTAGSLLSFILPFFGRRIYTVAGPAKKILFIRPGGIGDLILLIPSIKRVQKHFPSAEIDILCEKRNHEAVSFIDNIHTTYLYDRGLDLIKCINNNYDIVIDTEQWHHLSAVASFLSNAPLRIGFNTNSRKRLLTHTIPYSHEEREIRSFLNLLKPLKIPDLSFAPSAPFIHLKDNICENTDHTVTIAPGASVPERIWNLSNYAEVAAVLDKNGYKVVLLGSSNDKKLTSEIKKLEPACIDQAGTTDLHGTALSLKKSKVLLSPDSGIMHLSYALDVPTISLFGAGIEKKWAPEGPRHIIINKRLPCSPCTRFGHTPGCRKGTNCMSSITVDDVRKSLERLLDRPLL